MSLVFSAKSVTSPYQLLTDKIFIHILSILSAVFSSPVFHVCFFYFFLSLRSLLLLPLFFQFSNIKRVGRNRLVFIPPYLVRIPKKSSTCFKQFSSLVFKKPWKWNAESNVHHLISSLSKTVLIICPSGCPLLLVPILTWTAVYYMDVKDGHLLLLPEKATTSGSF